MPTDSFEQISKNIEDAYNLGVDNCIDIINEFMGDIKRHPTPRTKLDLLLLEILIKKFANIKK